MLTKATAIPSSFKLCLFCISLAPASFYWSVAICLVRVAFSPLSEVYSCWTWSCLAILACVIYSMAYSKRTLSSKISSFFFCSFAKFSWQSSLSFSRSSIASEADYSNSVYSFLNSSRASSKASLAEVNSWAWLSFNFFNSSLSVYT
jgi:hypothetical protein